MLTQDAFLTEDVVLMG